MYDSDQEQLEALKGWWKENGKAVLLGLALGLAGVLGWTFWRSHQKTQAERASVIYEQLIAAPSGKAAQQAQQQASALLENQPHSEYAALTALVLADRAFARKQPAEARRFLTWILDHADSHGIRMIARLRLARLLSNEHNYDGAIALLEHVEPGPFAGAFAEVRGDILQEKGDSAGARTAYSKALDHLQPGTPEYQRVTIKLDDLGGQGSPAPQASTAGNGGESKP